MTFKFPKIKGINEANLRAVTVCWFPLMECLHIYLGPIRPDAHLIFFSFEIEGDHLNNRQVNCLLAQII